MIFRRAEARDTEALRDMMRTSNGYATPEARAMIDAYATSWLPDADTWVVEDERGLAGFHSLKPIDAQTLDLDLMFVADTRQGEGLGARLFAQLSDVARARGASRIVILANPGAEGFYRRMGAREDGTVPAGRFVAWPRQRLVVDLT